MRVYTNDNRLSRQRRPGYLLLEVVLAMGIASALLISIFMIASGSLSLSERIVEEGRITSRHESFLNFFERSLEELPGNAEVRLSSVESSGRLLPTLTIQNAPTSFGFEGLPIAAQAVVIRTTPAPGGGLNVVLDYYESQLLDDGDGLAEERPEPVGSLILYRDIWRFELRALQVSTMTFVTDWETSGRWPVQMELNAIFEPDGGEIVQHFWLPGKANPAQLVQGIGQQGGRARGGQNGAESGPPQAPAGGRARGAAGQGNRRPGGQR